jgi:hypothetical protein
MPAPKWLVVARNEYRVNTGRVRKLRPLLPILFVAAIAVYVFFIAPKIVDRYIGDYAAQILSQVAFAQMRIILATIFIYSIMIPIQTSLRQEPMGRLEIYLSSPIGAGDVLLGEFLGQMPSNVLFVSIFAGILAALMGSVGVGTGQQVIVVVVFIITVFSGLWTGSVIAAVVKTRLRRTAKGRDIGKALAMAMALPLVVLYYGMAYGGLLTAFADPNSGGLVKAFLAMFPSSWGSDVILLIAKNPGGLLLDSRILMGFGGVVTYFVGMLWLGGKIADRAYSLEPTAMTDTKVGRDGAFYNTVKGFGGGGSFGALLVSVFKDYARRLENITNVSYIVMVLIIMNVFITPQYEGGPGEPPVPLMMALFILPIITVMVTGDITVQGKELLFIYKKAPNAVWRFLKAMVLKSWLVVVPIATGTALVTSPFQPGTTLDGVLGNTMLMALFSSANAVFVTGLFLVNPAYSDKSPKLFINVFISLIGSMALFAASLYISTMGFSFEDPIFGLTGVSLLHTGFNLLLGYAAMLVGRRRLIAME